MGARIGVAIMAGVTLAFTAACSGSSGPSSQERPATTTVAPSPSATIAPEVIEALKVYRKYVRSRDQALVHPVAKGSKVPDGEDFSQWSYDPAQAETLVYVHALASYGAEYRGRPPESHLRLRSVDLQASPYPSVDLLDCQVPQGAFLPYDAKTGQKLELEGDVDPVKPYPALITLILVKGRWGVTSFKSQREATCDPDDANLPEQ